MKLLRATEAKKGLNEHDILIYFYFIWVVNAVRTWLEVGVLTTETDEPLQWLPFSFDQDTMIITSSKLLVLVVSAAWMNKDSINVEGNLSFPTMFVFSTKTEQAVDCFFLLFCFIADIPLHINIRETSDFGSPIVVSQPDSAQVCFIIWMILLILLKFCWEYGDALFFLCLLLATETCYLLVSLNQYSARLTIIGTHDLLLNIWYPPDSAIEIKCCVLCHIFLDN